MKSAELIKIYPLTFAGVVLSAMCCAVTAFFSWQVAAAELLVLLVWICIAVYRVRRDFKAVRRTVAAMSASLYREDDASLQSFPLPVAVFDSADRVLWYNRRFQSEVLTEISPKSKDIRQFTGGMGLEKIREKSRFNTTVGKRAYTVYFSPVENAGKPSYALIFAEDTELKATAHAYALSKPAVAMIVTDSAEEIYRTFRESEYAEITGALDRIIEEWFSGYDCVFRKLGGGRFLAVLPENALQRMIDAKFDVLERVRSYTFHNAPVGLTLSIGVGRGDTLSDAESNARQALDMALGRGGDQTALKGRDDVYRFFGGVSKGVEKRTKVRTRVVASAIAEMLRNCDQVFIMGHKFSDIDSIGAAVGMRKAALTLQKKAKIVTSEKTSLALPLIEYVRAETDEDCFISSADAEDALTDKTLLIVVDTHRQDFTEAPELCEKASSVIVIDHHRKTVDYIRKAVIFYHEPHASSACEMVTELLEYMDSKPVLTALEANALLAGIMLDTKDFILRTGVRTFEAAAFLRARGADTVRVNSFFNSSLESKKLCGQVVLGAQFYRGCAISTANMESKDIRVIAAKAADELLTVSGVDASFVLFPTDSTINISARSMGKVNVQLVMESLGGGGHQTMAAAQLSKTTLSEALERLKTAIDTYFSEQ